MNRFSLQRTRLLLCLLFGLAAACAPDEAEERRGNGGEAQEKQALTSDGGCPPPKTIGSGPPSTGPISFGILHGRRSGGTGGQVGMLLSSFNRRVQQIGDQYCAEQHCYAEVVNATGAHVRTGRSRDFIGWTELTIIPTGGRPRTVTPGLDVYFSYVDPPSPNVACRQYDFIEDTIQEIDLTPTPPTGGGTGTTPPPPPPTVQCPAPNPAVRLDPQILASRAFSGATPLVPLTDIPGLATWDTTTGPAAYRAKLAAALARARCPQGCTVVWDRVPQVTKVSGYATRPLHTFVIYFELLNTVRAKCQ